ncbi:ABC transporter permease [Polynucleobacter brandtiae]|uniref:Putative ABC transport system permease protein n=1 Tax=Polynucleobacter brandtiae TaxID=1938816 RepID=A0A2M8VH92_9BURK|nr:ABC transporter permease [Polynucleobacter brandtiae]PJI76060.1 putative ABC transport system permease protein [Polynucleobacter brandtiae]
MRLFYWLLVSAFRAQPGRWLIAGATVALGIGLAVAIHTVNRSALSEFGRALDLINGQASAQLVMPAGEFPDALYDEVIARQSELGIQAVSPVFERNTKAIRVLGLDIFKVGKVTPALLPSALEGKTLDIFDANTVFLSAAALSSLNLAIGDDLTISLEGKKESFRIAGSVPGVAGESLAVMDLGLAQWRLNGLGRLSRLDIQLVQGRSLSQVAAALAQSHLGLILVTADDRQQRMSNLSRAYRVNLTVLALVALFTGGFLVFTTIGFSVLRQQSQLALLSVLGARQGWLFALILTQAAFVSAIGGVFGIGFGLALAAVLLRVLGGDLGAGYFSSVVPPLDIDPVVLAGFWFLSVAVGVLAGYLPARVATNRAPMQQLRAGASERILKSITQGRLAISLALLGLVLALMPAIDGLPIAAYISIACVLFAGIAMTPILVSHCFVLLKRLISRPSSRSPSSSLTLAIWRLAQASASASVLITGVVAALALTVAMVVMVASFRDSVTQWLDQVLPADLYANLSRLDLDQSLINNPRLQDEISAIPGIARVEFSLQQKVIFRADRPEVVLISRPIPLERAAQVLPLTGDPVVQVASGAALLPQVFVSESMTDLYGWKPGQVQDLPLTGSANNTISVWVGGIFRDYGRQHGAIVIDSASHRSLTNDDRRTDIAIWLKPGSSSVVVLEKFRSQFPQMMDLEFRSSANLRALSLTIFDRSFALTYALEIAALLVALFSVAVGFAGQALIRQKEFALMQHLGQSVQERALLLIFESGMLLGIATIWGTVLGLLMSQLLIHRVNPQSFGWTMDTSVPILALTVLALAIVLLGMIAAVWASNRSLNSKHLALALREDW